jgi:hypothetical protein
MARKREVPVKEILGDGRLVYMTPKEARRWHRKTKTKIVDGLGYERLQPLKRKEKKG